MNIKAIRVHDMSNLYFPDTGVKGRIWVSSKFAGHKVPRCKYYGNDLEVSVSIEDNPKIIAPKSLRSLNLDKVFQWVRLNKEALIDYWNNPTYSTSEFLNRLKRIK